MLGVRLKWLSGVKNELVFTLKLAENYRQTLYKYLHGLQLIVYTKYDVCLIIILQSTNKMCGTCWTF